MFVELVKREPEAVRVGDGPRRSEGAAGLVWGSPFRRAGRLRGDRRRNGPQAAAGNEGALSARGHVSPPEEGQMRGAAA